jgi:hypothetical protein
MAGTALVEGTVSFGDFGVGDLAFGIPPFKLRQTVVADPGRKVNTYRCLRDEGPIEIEGNDSPGLRHENRAYEDWLR